MPVGTSTAITSRSAMLISLTQVRYWLAQRPDEPVPSSPSMMSAAARRPERKNSGDCSRRNEIDAPRPSMMSSCARHSSLQSSALAAM